MGEKKAIYIKRSGEVMVPVTARITWFPDGRIKPCFYWTPDGTQYKILSHGIGVSLALFRCHAEGLRFKVISQIIETPDPFSELLNSRYETELYLEDSRFFQKNIIDTGYAHPNKEYIQVTMDVFPNSEYEIISFCCKGSRYVVEKTLAVEPRGSYLAGGAGIWHKVDARLANMDDDGDPNPQKSICRRSALYLEFNKWFVSVATAT